MTKNCCFSNVHLSLPIHFLYNSLVSIVLRLKLYIISGMKTFTCVQLTDVCSINASLQF